MKILAFNHQLWIEFQAERFFVWLGFFVGFLLLLLIYLFIFKSESHKLFTKSLLTLGKGLIFLKNIFPLWFFLISQYFSQNLVQSVKRPINSCVLYCCGSDGMFCNCNLFISISVQFFKDFWKMNEIRHYWHPTW